MIRIYTLFFAILFGNCVFAARDPYEVLGIEKTATLEEIKAAHRRLALKYHPDRNKEEGAAEQFKEMQAAYELLSDSARRSQFDQFGHQEPPRGGTGGGRHRWREWTEEERRQAEEQRVKSSYQKGGRSREEIQREKVQL